MSDIDDLLIAGLRVLPPKPAGDARQAEKKGYSEDMSEVVAAAFAQALRNRNLELLDIVVERNPDFYEIVDGKLEKAT